MTDERGPSSGGTPTPIQTGRALLVVEDQERVANFVVRGLRAEGYAVTHCADGTAALETARGGEFAAILLDVMLPGLSGLEVCRQLRRRPETRDLPIIMVTARTEEADAVRALDTGADDHIGKPFTIEALLARIRAVMRRAAGPATKGALAWQDIAMDQDAHRVTRGGRSLHLGPTEYRLLEFFLQHPGRVFSREQLLDAVWGHDSDIESRTVDVHIRRLRKAINGADKADIIRTVRSAGYALDSGT